METSTQNRIIKGTMIATTETSVLTNKTHDDRLYIDICINKDTMIEPIEVLLIMSNYD